MFPSLFHFSLCPIFGILIFIFENHGTLQCIQRFFFNSSFVATCELSSHYPNSHVYEWCAIFDRLRNSQNPIGKYSFKYIHYQVKL